MTDQITESRTSKSGGFSKILIGAITFLVGLAIGAGGFYFLGPVAGKNLETEILAKTKEIKNLETKIDSLKAQMNQAKDISPAYTAILRRILIPDTLNEAVSLGTAVGGRWSVRSSDDVIFLGEDLLFIRMDDGHLEGMALLKVPDTSDLKTWRTLWAEYQ